MKKIKKNFVTPLVQRNKSNDSDDDIEYNNGNSDDDNDDNEDYDSMIDNGTSEDSDNNDDGNISNNNNSEIEDNMDNVANNKKQLKRKREINYENNSDKTSLKKIKSNKQLYKPPTVEELNQLRETENLFHSNLFRMQINEMLKEIQIKDKQKMYIEKWLIKFNDFLMKLNSMNDKENSNNLLWLKKAKLQIPIDTMSSKLINDENISYNFQFIKPIKKAFLIGSYKNGTLINSSSSSSVVIDICILIPSKYFQKDDHLNLIYDRKRALYLLYIAWKMINNDDICENIDKLHFNYYKNNPYKTILEIIPNNKIGKKLYFQIFTCPDENVFKLNRFVPWNSNIREKLFNNNLINEDELPLATPNYNANVLQDLTMKLNHDYIENLLCNHRNLQDGLILLKIWLKQRNLNIGYSGFSNFIMSMWVAYLFKIKKLHTSMSSYQIARNTWNYLAVSTWNEDGKGISLCDDYSKPNQPTLEQFHAYYDIVFVDISGFQNICANLSLDLYLRIKYESQYAIELLNNKRVNSFQLLFMTKIPIYMQYDHIFKICDVKSIENIVENHCVKYDKHNFAGAWYPIVLKEITSILRKGLSDRIVSMVPIEIPSKSWEYDGIPKIMKKQFFLGFQLNHSKSFEILNKGPQTINENESNEYRKFWGEKSKLRRFQDGSIVEACVWSLPNDILTKKRKIVQHIIYYLINYHFNINYNIFKYYGFEFDKIYSLNEQFYLYKNNDKLIDAESTTLNVINNFDEICRNLRELNQLPLDITSIHGISSVNRYCDPIPILNNSKYYLNNDRIIFQSYKIIDGVIQLGFSGKWPDELSAFRRIKTAFHIQIAQQLRKKYKCITNGSIDGVYILKNGYVFRFEIAHQKEIILINNQKDLNSKSKKKFNLELDKRFNILPKITSALHGLYQQYTSFGPAVMIAKRWLYSHMIDSYLWPDECTEFLIASLYLNVNVYQNPFQPQIGFIRFLHLLSTTDWKNQLFLLNFNDEMTQEKINELESRFNNERDSFPPLTIITSYDTDKYDSIWSINAPITQILAYIQNLAKHSLEIIENKYLTKINIEINDLFTPNLNGYNLIINLRSNHVHSCLAKTLENSKRSKSKIDATIPAIGFDPVQRGLQQLREAYSEFAVFFYDPCGGKKIGVIWKPDIFIENDFKIQSVNGCYVTENKKLKCNRLQLIEDFKITLRNLYYSIEEN